MDHKTPMKNIAVFVDVQNIYYTVKDFIDSKTPKVPKVPKVTIDIVPTKPKRTHPTRKSPNLHTNSTIRPICKYHREGRCSYGSKCRNRHN